ncbi:MAG: hypothetical protein K8F35_11420 [Dokdonella sp.]|uniref:type II secretion system protein GspL n=1 Tax=Dokdonella sp. TaxID=2291710 RepID=UPI0025C411B8|nr:type II secretion system protein GspL [Dokdonella sp.]MBZ0223626.1 hypothetical protein [Dokdonella sp.]
MSDRLFLRLAADGSLSWLRTTASTAAVRAVPGVPPAPALAQAREVIVLVPASEVLLTQTALTARNRATLLKALPFAVEDLLLAPVDSLHFAAASAHEGKVGVAVVARATLDGWLDRLAAEGIVADVLIPESLALAPLDGGARVLLDAQGALVRMGPWSAFACAVDELASWFAVLPAASACLVHDARGAGAAALGLPGTMTVEVVRDPLALLAAQAAELPLNLLDGEYAIRRRRRSDGARWWRVAAALSAAVVVLAVLTLGTQVWRLSREAARLDLAAREAVLKALPDLDAKVFDRTTPAQLVAARIGTGGQTTTQGVLGVLDRIGPVLGDGGTRIQTRAVDYRNGVLELALRAPDLNALDLVRERIAMLPGCKAELTAANPGADGVDGRVRVEIGKQTQAVQR